MKYIKYVLFVFLFYYSVSSQDFEMQFENISTFSGLSATSAKCLFQDSNGYLWIGTMDGGLNRYDGHTFTVYKYDASDSTSLVNNAIYSLAEDSAGNIWVATTFGISKFITSQEKFINYSLDRQFKKISKLPWFHVYEVFVDFKNRIWFGTSHLGALLYDKENDKFLKIPHQNADTIDSSQQVYSDFSEDSEGKLWAATGEGLFWYNEQSKIFQKEVIDFRVAGVSRAINIFRIYCDSKNDVWIMTNTDVFKYFPNTKKIVHLLDYEIPNPENNGYEGELLEDSRGNMWVVHINLNSPVKFTGLSEKPLFYKTENQQATDIYFDSFGILWISDWFRGLHKYVPTKQSFIPIHTKVKNYNISRPSFVAGVSQSLMDPDLVFFSSASLGINAYNKTTGKVKSYNLALENGGSLAANKDGSFWISHWDDGLFKWNPYTNLSKYYFQDSTQSINLLDKAIIDLSTDNNGHLWIGTSNGLYKLNSDEELELVIPEGVFISTHFDEDIVWAGTYNGGFIKYNIYSKNIKTYKHDKNSNSLSNDIVWDIERDNEGFLWIATAEGLNRFDLRTDHFDVFGESDGLAEDYIAAIIPYENGTFWMSTKAGITLMHKDSKNRISFSNYDVEDGLNNPNFLYPISAIDNSGFLYFGGQNGLYAFKPEIKSSTPPLTHITGLEINGKPYNKPDQGDLNLELSYQENTILFEFIALHYANPGKNKYAYFLEGYDSDWVYSKNREIQYVNLDPGLYKFHLRAANRNGIWNSEDLVVPVNIANPWWKTWYAYILYLGLILGGLTGARQFELNRRQENENKKLLEAENRRKSEELEEARQLQLSMLPKELPQLPNLDIAVYMQTATEVGGDYYDFNVSIDGTLTVVIGDATGHGMKAGTMVTTAKSLFKSYGSNPDILFSFQEFTRCIKEMNFGKLSMCLTMLKIKGDKIQISSAGMPPSFIFRCDTRVVEEHLFKAMPLGTMKNFPYEVKDTILKPGDTILLMSDGLPELNNDAGEMYGYKRIRSVFEDIAEDSPEEIISYLKNEGATWVNDAPPDDDVTFVVIKVK